MVVCHQAVPSPPHPGGDDGGTGRTCLWRRFRSGRCPAQLQPPGTRPAASGPPGRWGIMRVYSHAEEVHDDEIRAGILRVVSAGGIRERSRCPRCRAEPGPPALTCTNHRQSTQKEGF
ncbi:hypothetical protein RHA1_ro08704 (plasmid) [Rhodococcus jostii RHA1]|uniref:Uncharacterized protein n=1 Tax=Rhodococcus jostii (strain RHA1) TaxID=101510 RepID=Q0RY88_RHOJR|nr:hypothetical protein RHA1_ro08704 [Rhodococcus jostii RHA1]